MCTVVMKIPDVGTTVVLRYCDLTIPLAFSELEFQWSKDGVDITSVGRFSVNHRGSLTVRNIMESDLGSYRVNISNSEGSAVHTVKLEKVASTTSPTPSTSGLVQRIADSKRGIRGMHDYVYVSGSVAWKQIGLVVMSAVPKASVVDSIPTVVAAVISSRVCLFIPLLHHT